MKILRVMDRLNVGGPAAHAILLTRYFGRDGSWSTRLIVGKEGKNEGNMLELAERNGVAPICIPSLGREIHPIRDLATFWKLYRQIRKEKPRIVHTHKSKAGVLGRLAAWMCGVPVRVHTFHGHVLHGYFGKMKSRVFILIERWMAKISDRIIAVSPRVKEDLLRYRIAPSEKIEVMGLGLDLKKYAEKRRNEGTLRRELGIGPEIPLAGIVARLVPIKGIPAFLRAAKQVLEKFSDARFVIVGDGELREGLEKLTEELGIKKSTHFLGFRDDLENIYPDLDVLVLTSRNEGSPVSLIEGLASGCAVVSTRVGGVEDVVKDGKTGILVGRTTEEETAKNLGHVICTLLENPEKRLEFGESGKKDVLKRFGIERLVADLDGLYRRLLAEKGIL